jgi:polysaccharide export outer membrane protein
MRTSVRQLHLFLLLLVAWFCPNAIAQEHPSASQDVSKPVQQIPAAPSVPSGKVGVSSADNSSSGLLLGPGDLIDVGVYNVPELTTKARIGSNGNVYLPLVDYVHLAGLTTEEAQDVIQKKLASGGFVRNPHVNIFVDEHASGNTSVLGEVGRPGIYPMLGQQRLFDLISAAGGLNERAGRSVSITHRSHPDEPVVVPLSRNLSDHPESNVLVFPGDTVIVRKADIVYVVGDVGRPSGFLMDNGRLTVLQAIALAGGTNKTAKLNGAKIIHRASSGMTETPVQLKKILQSKAPDQPLEAEDILFVPSSAGKIAMARVVDLAMSVSTAVTIVAVQ